jgi:replicative superfamily II helicase
MNIDVNNHIKLCQEDSKHKIIIKDRIFDIIPASKLVRNKDDGYYRVLYIQINALTGEYYIGKANRPTLSQLERYQGSGLRFKGKFNKYKKDFVKYYIAQCNTAEEIEDLEASIVNSSLLEDEFCLNLIAGGGGVSYHPTREEINRKLSQYMKNHPEQSQAMLEASKKAFQSGDTPELRARSTRIKEVMSSTKYAEMTRQRINNWKETNPEAYLDARRKNHESIKRSEVQDKRKTSLKQWKQDNPEKYVAWEKNRIEALKDPASRQKRKDSLAKWRNENPKAHQENSKNRAKQSIKVTSKPVCMLDLSTGKVLREFDSQHDAARWLVDQGIAKNTNCVNSISAVCRGKRNKTQGYGWCFK